jgi:hypothetical protein
MMVPDAEEVGELGGATGGGRLHVDLLVRRVGRGRCDALVRLAVEYCKQLGFSGEGQLKEFRKWRRKDILP